MDSRGLLDPNPRGGAGAGYLPDASCRLARGRQAAAEMELNMGNPHRGTLDTTADHYSCWFQPRASTMA
jgi:hypothetical protein